MSVGSSRHSWESGISWEVSTSGELLESSLQLANSLYSSSGETIWPAGKMIEVVEMMATGRTCPGFMLSGFLDAMEQLLMLT